MLSVILNSNLFNYTKALQSQSTYEIITSSQNSYMRIQHISIITNGGTHMTNNELLLSISDMMDAKLLPIEQRMDRFDQKLDKVEKNLNAKIDSVEQNLNARIDSVQQNLNARIDSVEQNLNARIDSVEQNLNARIDSVEQNLNCVEQSLNRQIHILNLKLENIIEPRLNEIESCYISTSERYQIAIEKFQSHEIDLSVIKSIIQEHSKKLKQCTA